jgi:hypothetical protein
MNTDVKSIRRRRIASIFQHYYPEGGWGIIVLVCGFSVVLLSDGLQQSFGILIAILSIRFHISDMAKIGKGLIVIYEFCKLAKENFVFVSVYLYLLD